MAPFTAARKLVWDNILTLPYYQPGKPIEEVERELGISGIIKLASNENPLGPSPKAIEAIRSAASKMHYYPDATGYFLKRKLAGRLGIDPELIGLGNGADELITFVAAAFIHDGDEALIPSPTFIRYETAVQMMGGTPRKLPLRDWTIDLKLVADNVGEKTKMIFLCNPNNPTGTVFGRRELEEFLERVPPEIIIVFDEAYREYVETDDYPDTLGILKEGDRRVVILRTFSKIYGLAGLRLGYGLATKELADVLKLVRAPFNASAMAQAAGLAALDDDGHVERSRRINGEGKRMIYEAFDRLGIKYAPSQTNFIFFDSGRDGIEVFDALLRKGVIIRPLTIGSSRRFLRVSIGTREQNERFISSLEEVLESLPPAEEQEK